MPPLIVGWFPPIPSAGRPNRGWARRLRTPLTLRTTASPPRLCSCGWGLGFSTSIPRSFTFAPFPCEHTGRPVLRPLCCPTPAIHAKHGFLFLSLPFMIVVIFFFFWPFHWTFEFSPFPPWPLTTRIDVLELFPTTFPTKLSPLQRSLLRVAALPSFFIFFLCHPLGAHNYFFPFSPLLL